MKLAVLTQYYPPEIGAQPARLSHLAGRAAERGHDVTVLTAMPNYPTGKIFDGYKGYVRRERNGGIRSIRTFIYPTQEAKILPRLATYLSFAASVSTLGAAFLPRPDYLFVQSPPLSLGLAGWWLSRLKRTRLIFNVSDLWPESGVQLGLMRENGKIHRLSSRIEAFSYRKAWLITGQSRSILENIQSRFPGRPTFNLQNGVDIASFGPQFATAEARRALRGEMPQTTKVALYAGLHGVAQGLEQVINAAARLQDRAGPRFVFVGEGPEKAMLIDKAHRLKLRNVAFLDPRPAREIPSLLAASDIILVPLKLDIRGAVPSKLYEAMATGRPVAMAASGEAAAIVRDHSAGFAVAPGDDTALADVVERLTKDDVAAARLGENGRRAAQANFDRNAVVDKFLEHLETELTR